MLSNSSKYALKAVLLLAMQSDEDHKLMVKDISQRINVPKVYTGKLLQRLAKQDIICSSRGPKGGFYIDQNRQRQSIMTIINAIDGSKKMESCIIGLDDCDKDRPCPLHDLVASSRSKIQGVFERTTLEELAKHLRNKKSFLSRLG